MEANHIYAFSQNKNHITNIEIVWLVKSILHWRKLYNTPIKLKCNTKFHQYLRVLGIDKYYDKIEVCLDDLPTNINYDVFWSASKFFAYKKIVKPTAVFDIDFYFQKYVKLPECDLFYTSLDHHNKLFKIEDYTFPESYPEEKKLIFENSLAIECSMLIFNNMELKDKYIENALEFIVNNPVNKDKDYENVTMSEQGMLYHTAKDYNTISLVGNSEMHSYNHLGMLKKTATSKRYEDVFEKNIKMNITEHYPSVAYNVLKAIDINNDLIATNK